MNILTTLFVILIAAYQPMPDNLNLQALYQKLTSETEKPSFEVFEKAITGYNILKTSHPLNEKDILTIIDFSLSSKTKRLWVIDLKSEKILHHALVAHGKNTGDEFAFNFSNTPKSYKSSLGFYLTGKTYYGKHGLSLYLDGMEEGFNKNARKRNVVIHGANYVSKDFIKKYGRLGRSYGCPALSMEKHKEIINTIKGKTCIFIYYPDKNYLKSSKLINQNV